MGWGSSVWVRSAEVVEDGAAKSFVVSARLRAGGIRGRKHSCQREPLDSCNAERMQRMLMVHRPLREPELNWRISSGPWYRSCPSIVCPARPWLAGTITYTSSPDF